MPIKRIQTQQTFIRRNTLTDTDAHADVYVDKNGITLEIGECRDERDSVREKNLNK